MSKENAEGSINPGEQQEDTKPSETITKDLGFIPIPPYLRFSSSKSIHYGLLLHILFCVTTTFTVANLFTTNTRIPTLTQAGYAIGLAFIAPLGDLVRRRQLIPDNLDIPPQVVIGLFGLIGLVGIVLAPIMGRLIDTWTPWHSSLLCTLMLTIFQAILVGAAGINIAPVVLASIGIDVFRGMLQVSLSAAVFSIAPEARARLNAVALLSMYLGQVTGTAADTAVFVRFGWRAAAALLLGLQGWQLFILLLRGPHCHRYTWFGYEGGFRISAKGDTVKSVSSNDAGSD